MGTFKVPSPSTSPTSTGGSDSPSSPRGFFFHRDSLTYHRRPREASTSSSTIHSHIESLRGSRWSRSNKRSPGRPPRVRFTLPSPTASTASFQTCKSSFGAAASTEDASSESVGGNATRASTVQDPKPKKDGISTGTRLTDDKAVDQHLKSLISEPANDVTPHRTMQAIRNIASHPNIASPFEEDCNQAHEFPAEYRGAGTLEYLIRTRTPTHHSQRKNYAVLPEPLIWHTLISLLRAAHFLHTGGRSSEEGRDSTNWQPIVHSSINPSNISFMHVNNGGRLDTGAYKTCVLGNLSKCTVLPHIVDSAQEDENDRKHRREAFSDTSMDMLSHPAAPVENTGFQAPELFGFIPENVPGPASDLWSIGAVMVAMMTGRNVWEYILEADFLTRQPADGVRPKKWRDVPLQQRLLTLMSLSTGSLRVALPGHYSEGLRMVVEGLLVFDPRERGGALGALKSAETMHNECTRR